MCELDKQIILISSLILKPAKVMKFKYIFNNKENVENKDPLTHLIYFLPNAELFPAVHFSSV